MKVPEFYKKPKTFLNKGTKHKKNIILSKSKTVKMY